MHESERIVSKMPTIKHRYTTRCKTGCTAVTFAEPTYAKRIMHSCLALGISILFGPDTVRLDAVGTHLVENNIGIARSLSNSTKFSNIVSAFAKTELRKDVARKYGMKLYVHKRINDGGAKVNTLDKEGLEFPGEFHSNDIISSFFEFFDPAVGKCARKEVKKFCRVLREFLGYLTIQQLSDTSEVANALIVQRNYRFKSTNAQEDDKTD